MAKYQVTVTIEVADSVPSPHHLLGGLHDEIVGWSDHLATYTVSEPRKV